MLNFVFRTLSEGWKKNRIWWDSNPCSQEEESEEGPTKRNPEMELYALDKSWMFVFVLTSPDFIALLLLSLIKNRRARAAQGMARDTSREGMAPEDSSPVELVCSMLRAR